VDFLEPSLTVDDNTLALAAKIKLLLFDVDGVLTDGRLFLGDDGQEYKAFHSRDGHGIRMLQDSGVPVGLITGRTSRVVKHRIKDLDIKHVYQGKRDKLPAYIALCKKLGLDFDQVAFVGDDVVDLPVMLKTGLAVAVQDAHPLVKQHAHWTTPSQGGKGAGRDVCELILFAQDRYDQAMGLYLN